MSQDLNKSSLVNTLTILLDLGKESQKELATLSKQTLQEMYDNYIVNARQANQAAFQRITSASGNKNPT